MIEILSVSGSPVQQSSTDILLETVAHGLADRLNGREVNVTTVKLNELKFVPCQACRKAPTPEWCLFEDDLTPFYDKIAGCDCLLFGSPVYFDSVSAQAKAFIDRGNCFRPADFESKEPECHFVQLLHRKRPGAIVLVGGEGQWFEGARRTIAGFFKWLEVTNEGLLTYASKYDNRKGTVGSAHGVLRQALELGARLAPLVVKAHEAQRD